MRQKILRILNWGSRRPVGTGTRGARHRESNRRRAVQRPLAADEGSAERLPRRFATSKIRRPASGRVRTVRCAAAQRDPKNHSHPPGANMTRFVQQTLLAAALASAFGVAGAEEPAKKPAA